MYFCFRMRQGFTYKILAFLLLTMLVYKNMLFFVGFEVYQNQLRKEIKDKITSNVSEAQTQSFLFSTEEISKLCWKRYNKELFFQDRLFYVVEIEKKGAYVFYRCVEDVVATSMYKQLNTLLDDSFSDSSKGKDVRSVLQMLLFSPYVLNEKTSNFALTTTHHQYFLLNISYHGRFIIPEKQPPKFLA